MLNNILRQFVHILLPTRKPLQKYLKKISKRFNDKDILEIGSGSQKRNQSMKKLFQNANSFLQTDINKEYGHHYLDITNISNIHKKFDLVLCTNVLEHIFEIELAISNLTALVKQDGYLIISMPFIYPLHDEPEDYWRLTEHNLRNLFSDFLIEDFQHTGLRQFPSQYILLLKN
tara:strand:+ start:254 stop:775 length:522 start_codon:yes stop_codon:yes gene_type:complete